MQRRTLLRLSLAVGASVALAGCGFHLRGYGQPALSLEALAVAGRDSDFSRLATDRLEAAGTRIRDDAPLVLNLGAEEFEERSLSVLDSGSQEHEMTLRVPFSVQRRADRAYRLDQQTLEVSGRFEVSEDNLLAGDEQREAVSERLRREAVRQLLDRLRPLAEA
ncbi:LPS assembly lipoprotein LptE [Halomonas nitroreducens]|uniref:LPS-assembly lipoprotein LptE n=1 Tax=Halomonas nitroreducens TaxID=447425 RepID=A0A3S0HUI5_9GAMM|nr:LPS assembly lipoprotein LptE [Halomonas nitroreducens]RTR05369.1 hypothetical protein EKG36_07230 [Halomonas nitroreducens]